jgi:hypothetical protein
MIYDIAFALSKLAPGAKWVHRGEPMDFDGIEWNDDTIAPPFREQIQAVIDEYNIKEPMRLLRRERDKRIAQTDWWAVADRTMSPEQVAYRQALRDITENATPQLNERGQLDMDSVQWPYMP